MKQLELLVKCSFTPIGLKLIVQILSQFNYTYNKKKVIFFSGKIYNCQQT